MNVPKKIPNFGIQQYNKSTTNLGAHNSNRFTIFDPRTRRSHLFMSGAPGAAVSFTQDGSQDRPYMFVQLASSSDSERIFSTMNDIYHGRSWGTCLASLCPPLDIICTSRWQ